MKPIRRIARRFLSFLAATAAILFGATGFTPVSLDTPLLTDAFAYDDASRDYDRGSTLSLDATPRGSSSFRGHDTLPNGSRAHTSPLPLRRAPKAGAGVGTALVPRTSISGHAAGQMAERGITRGQVDVALRKGTRYYDARSQTYSHVLEGGYASGKGLTVATDPLTGNVATAIRRSRPFNPDVLYNGRPRYTSAPPGG